MAATCTPTTASITLPSRSTADRIDISDTVADTFLVTVGNVAPTASLANDGPVNEGSTATVSISGQIDPSLDDTADGFHYAYDFDNDGTWDVGDGSYGGSVVADSQVVPASYLDDGAASVTVKARILDDDGGFTDYITVIASGQHRTVDCCEQRDCVRRRRRHGCEQRHSESMCRPTS